MYSKTIFALVLLIGYVQCNPLHVQLSVAKIFKVGQEVSCKVTLSNGENKDVFVFHQGTPLEGLISDYLEVTRNSLPVHYDGPFYKRPVVNMQSEGTTLKSNESVSVEADLSSAYEVGKNGRYVAALRTKMYFYGDDEVIQSVNVRSRPVEFVVEGEDTGSLLTSGQKHRNERAKHTDQNEVNKVEAGTPKSLSFIGIYDSVDAFQANDAWSRAYVALTGSISDMSTNPNHYKKWFGVLPTLTPWSTSFGILKSAMEEDSFILYFRPPTCEKNVYAYTYVGSRVIYLCDGYIYAQAYGYDSKFGTLVHEMSHAVVGTQDLAYGVDDCQDLAKNNPTEAVMNADNYEYFVETL